MSKEKRKVAIDLCGDCITQPILDRLMSEAAGASLVDVELRNVGTVCLPRLVADYGDILARLDRLLTLLEPPVFASTLSAAEVASVRPGDIIPVPPDRDLLSIGDEMRATAMGMAGNASVSFTPDPED